MQQWTRRREETMAIVLMLGLSSNTTLAILLILGGVWLFAGARSLAEPEGSWSRWSEPYTEARKRSMFLLIRILGTFFVAFGAAVILVRAFWP